MLREVFVACYHAREKLDKFAKNSKGKVPFFQYLSFLKGVPKQKKKNASRNLKRKTIRSMISRRHTVVYTLCPSGWTQFNVPSTRLLLDFF